MSANNIAGPLTVKKPVSYRDRQFSIESDWESTDGDWYDRYVCFGGFFGCHGPHVFAAAPELLEALVYARRFLKEQDHDVGYVDAIIAKAKGVQP